MTGTRSARVAFRTASIGRRDVIAGSIALAAIGAGVAGITLIASPAQIAWRPPSPRLVPVLSDIVLPKTGTPGASGGDPNFVERALGSGLFGGDGTTLGLLEAWLDVHAKQSSFMAAARQRQLQVIEALDADTFSRAAPPPPVATSSHAPEASRDHVAAPAEPEINRLWRIVKQAIVTGYYTSEVGGAVELHYDLVPGRFDPDVALGSVPYLSNYWLENVF
ncbi:MAG TPA: gluconate 2-dehydrogenase subunit 3 family protein [Sphingomonas sp.]|nr:gluconate 2-dehydrogenase subunit 3 family protein [Sphingomonas sp.]